MSGTRARGDNLKKPLPAERGLMGCGECDENELAEKPPETPEDRIRKCPDRQWGPKTAADCKGGVVITSR